MRSATLLLLAFLAMLVGGCGQNPARPPALASKPPQTAGNDSTHWSESQAICLADPVGNTALDQQIRKLQTRVKMLPAVVDGWIPIGRSWVQKARLASDPGFYVNVQACADEVLRIQPGNPSALGLYALVYMNNHQFREADAVAKQILEKDPADIIALGIRSDALMELGDFEGSSEATQQMMNIRPDMSSYSRASYIRWLQGDSANAKGFIRQALEGRDTRDPESAAWTFVQAGMLYWHEGDYEGADAIFAEALKWVPDYPGALVARGRAALSRKDPNAAMQYLSRAYKIHPLPETAWMLGDARVMSGDLQGGEAEYKKVIDEGKRTDRLTLAFFYASKNRNTEEALRLIEEERKVRGNIYVEDTFAWVLYRLGRFEEARKASDRALRFGTRDARLLYHAGAIRIAAGDAAGRKIIDQALKLNPDFDWNSVAEARNLMAVSYAKKN